MGSSFKETILKLLYATNYSLDNLSQDEINSFENLQHLKPLFEWLSQNVTEANCITTEELEKFKELQETGKVKVGDELDEALQAHLYQDGASLVPFKESLNYAEQELTLLKEELRYKQILHKHLRSSNEAKAKEIHELKKELHEAEFEQKDRIKNVCAANKKLKDKVAELQANLRELREDIVGLGHNAVSPDISADEGIHTLTSDNLELNRSSTSVWSLASSSSWQTIRSKDTNIKYLCQLSLEGYQKVHKQFLKCLNRLLDNLSKVGRLQSNKTEQVEFMMLKERLEKQMVALIESEADLEGIKTARAKVKELKRAVDNGECLISRIKYEENMLDSSLEDDSFNSSHGCREDVASVCQQWVDLQVLRVVELKQRKRVNHSKHIIKTMDEVLSPVLLKLKADKILLEVLQYEKERIEMSVNLYKSFYLSLKNQYDRMKENIDKMQNNLQDYEQFCKIPLEQRSKLLERLASIVLGDNKGVVNAVNDLVESSRREHETMFDHYDQEKNALLISGKNIEESSNMVTCRSFRNEEVSTEIVDSIQQGLDQLNLGIEDVYNGIHEVIYNIANEETES